jgi:hypothetical protein
MDTSLAALLNLYTFSTGRRLFALGQLMKAAEERGIDDLVAHCKAAVAEDRRTRALEVEWDAIQFTPRGNSELGRVDTQLDRALVAIRDTAESQAAGADDPDLSARVTVLLRAIFPTGVQTVTQAHYVEELALVEGILATLKQKNHAALVAELGLGRLVKRLGDLCGEYRRLLESDVPLSIDFTVVRAARAEGQTRLLEAVAMVLGRFPGAGTKDSEARAALLDPVMRQNEAIRKTLRTRRQTPDVNPETGELDATPTPPAAAPVEVASPA